MNKTCSCCGWALDELSQSPEQENKNLCMWCDNSQIVKDTTKELEELFVILENFINKYKDHWAYNNYAKAIMGNIIISSVKLTANLCGKDITERLNKLLEKLKV